MVINACTVANAKHCGTGVGYDSDVSYLHKLNALWGADVENIPYSEAFCNTKGSFLRIVVKKNNLGFLLCLIYARMRGWYIFLTKIFQDQAALERGQGNGQRDPRLAYPQNLSPAERIPP